MYYETELCHHGIKGQKWGVRRFQNPDGSLTKAGLKRYNELSGQKKGRMTNRHINNAMYISKKLKKAEKENGPFKSQEEVAAVIKDDVAKALSKDQRAMLKSLHEKAASKDGTRDDMLRYLDVATGYGRMMTGSAMFADAYTVRVSDIGKPGHSYPYYVQDAVEKAIFDINWKPGDFDHIK